MTTKEIIFNEIKKVLEPLLDELFDFIRFLESKAAQQRMKQQS